MRQNKSICYPGDNFPFVQMDLKRHLSTAWLSFFICEMTCCIIWKTSQHNKTTVNYYHDKLKQDFEKSKKGELLFLRWHLSSLSYNQ